MPQQTTPQLLVLDFGGVVTKTPFETHRETENALQLAAGSLTWRGPFDPQSDALWCDMIADKITERDYWQTRAREVGAMLGQNWTTMQEFIVAARAAEPMKIIRPEFLEAIARARAAGKRLAILSNELDLFYGRDFRHKLPFLADFETIVDATYTGVLKPDPRAYALLTQAAGVPPGACVFVDDQRRNVIGAEAAGMQGVHFDVMKPKASYDLALAKLGVKP